MDKKTELEIRRIIKIYKEDSMILEKAGYLDIVNDIMKDPKAVQLIMNKFDMVWLDDDVAYEKKLSLWRELLNQAQKTEGIDQTVIDALLNHIIDMSNCRPDNRIDDTIRKFDKILYSYDERPGMSAEPEKKYGNDYTEDNGWYSLRRSTKKPKVGEEVIVLGWRLAGICCATCCTYLGKGSFKYQFPNDYSQPAFTPLYWKPIGKIPEGIMDEYPE